MSFQHSVKSSAMETLRAMTSVSSYGHFFDHHIDLMSLMSMKLVLEASTISLSLIVPGSEAI